MLYSLNNCFASVEQNQLSGSRRGVRQGISIPYEKCHTTLRPEKTLIRNKTQLPRSVHDSVNLTNGIKARSKDQLLGLKKNKSLN